MSTFNFMKQLSILAKLALASGWLSLFSLDGKRAALIMNQLYHSGEEIHVGDSIRYAGHPGTIMFVIDRGEYSSEFPEKDWSDYGTGLMIRTGAHGPVMLRKANEDLEFLARATPTI